MSAPRVTLVGKPDCHLCEAAREVIAAVCAELGEPFVEVSIFDDLEGIGPARRRAILNHFGSAEVFVQATREELEGSPAHQVMPFQAMAPTSAPKIT